MTVVEILNMDKNSKNFKWLYNIYRNLIKKEYLIIDNLVNYTSVDKEFVKLNNLKSALIYPLKTINKEYGSIQVFNKEVTYSEEDVKTLRLFSPYILNNFIHIK
jgi:hypothetical protein